MDFMRSFVYVFDDEEWIKKTLIGALIGLVPILQLALAGYMVEVLRNVAEDDPRPLPAWDDLGDKFIKGLLVSIAGLIYNIIPSIFLCIVLAPVVAGGGALGSRSEEAAGVFIAVVSVCIGLLAVILGIVLSALFMAGLLRYAMGDQEFGTLLQFGENFNLLKDNLIEFVKLYLIFIVISIALSIVLPIGLTILAITICGPLVVTLALPYYLTAVFGHIYGQFTQEIGLSGGMVETAPQV